MTEMAGMRKVQVNVRPLFIPVGATGKQIKGLALSAGIEPSKWGSGELELREYQGSGARLLGDDDVPNGDDFGLREVDPKKEPGFKTLEGWDPAVVASYPDYIQKALVGQGARYFSGSWDDTTIGPPGFMTPHQISGAAYVPLVKVYTLSGNRHYHIPGATWVNERGEPNPYQSNGRFLLPMEDALPCVEAFRKYRAFRRERFGGGLPPEMANLSEAELRPIRDYIAMMKAEERAGWAQSALGPGYVPPHIAVQWNAEANRMETAAEVLARLGVDKFPPPPEVTEEQRKAAAIAPRYEPPLPVPTPLSEKVLTRFKPGWNRFYKAKDGLPEEVSKLTVKWNGLLRVRLKPDHVDDFGEFLGADVNGFDLTLKRHRSGKYYQVKLDAPDMKAVVEY